MVETSSVVDVELVEEVVGSVLPEVEAVVVDTVGVLLVVVTCKGSLIGFAKRSPAAPWPATR